MSAKGNVIVTHEIVDTESTDTVVGTNRKSVSLLILGSFLLSLGLCILVLHFRSPLHAEQSSSRNLSSALIAIAICAAGVGALLLSRRQAGGIPIPENNRSVTLIAFTLGFVGSGMAESPPRLVRAAHLPWVASLFCAAIVAAIALRYGRRLTRLGKLMGIAALLLGSVQVGILLYGTAQQWLDAPSSSRLIGWRRGEGMMLGDLVLTVHSVEINRIWILHESGQLTLSDSPVADVTWSVKNGLEAGGTSYAFNPDKTIWVMGPDAMYHRPHAWCVMSQADKCAQGQSDQVTVAPGEEKKIRMRLGGVYSGTWVPLAFVFQDKTLDTPLSPENLGPIRTGGMADTPENRELLAEWKVAARVGLVYSLP